MPTTKNTVKGRQRNGQISDSQQVRDWISEDKKERSKLKPIALMEQLKADGIEVSKSTATQVLYNEFRRKRKPLAMNTKRGGRRRAKKTPDIQVSDLISVKQLAEQLGGVDRLKVGIEALEQLSS